MSIIGSIGDTGCKSEVAVSEELGVNEASVGLIPDIEVKMGQRLGVIERRRSDSHDRIVTKGVETRQVSPSDPGCCKVLFGCRVDREWRVWGIEGRPLVACIEDPLGPSVDGSVNGRLDSHVDVVA